MSQENFFSAQNVDGLRRILLLIIAAQWLTVCACIQTPPKPPPSPVSMPQQGEPTAVDQHSTPADANLASLFSHIWRVTKAPSLPAPGSVFIFLANGTLLETSCTETYRIATWTINKASPRELRVVEDQQLAFIASITELSNSVLTMQKHLVRSKEIQEVAFTAVEGEYVCPDLPK